MESTLWKLTLHDGRVFNVISENKTQKTKFLRKYNELNNKGLVTSIEETCNGIHTTKQFLDLNKFSKHYENKSICMK